MALHRRVEFRIRILKDLIGNLKSNLNSKNIIKINRVVDIKEKLSHHARKAFGVIERSGAHKRRSDNKDFDILSRQPTAISKECKMGKHLTKRGR